MHSPPSVSVHFVAESADIGPESEPQAAMVMERRMPRQVACSLERQTGAAGPQIPAHQPLRRMPSTVAPPKVDRGESAESFQNSRRCPVDVTLGKGKDGELHAAGSESVRTAIAGNVREMGEGEGRPSRIAKLGDRQRPHHDHSRTSRQEGGLYIWRNCHIDSGLEGR
jgi:hypothetical protein